MSMNGPNYGIPGDLAGALIADAQKLIQSRTLWALVVAALAAWGHAHGHELAPKDQVALLTDILSAIQYAGLAAAAVFRVVAKGPLR